MFNRKLFITMNEEKTISKGMEVYTKGFGIGNVELVAQQSSENGSYPVYHVRLANGEVRHFTAEQIKPRQ